MFRAGYLPSLSPSPSTADIRDRSFILCGVSRALWDVEQHPLPPTHAHIPQTLPPGETSNLGESLGKQLLPPGSTDQH